jgi:hypothetical protein
MNINTLFSTHINKGDSREQVFDTLLRLHKKNPQLVLLHREGRRAYDDFIKTALEIEPRSFERVKYSSEWRIVHSSKHVENASLGFQFRHDVLHKLTTPQREFTVVIPLSLTIKFWLKQFNHSLFNLLVNSTDSNRSDEEVNGRDKHKTKERSSKRRYGD